MLVSDIDGTLTDADGRLLPENVRAVRRLIGAGVYVTAATGRTRSSARPAVAQLGLRLPVILLNGGEVYDYTEGRRLMAAAFDTAGFRAALAALRGTGLKVIAYADDQVLVERDDDIIRGYLYPASHWQIRVVPSLETAMEKRKMPIRKLAAIGGDAQTSEEALEEIRRSFPGVNAVRPDPVTVEAMPGGVSKGSALMWLLGHLNVEPGQVVAIGNAGNDREMLQAAGLGVAVADAEEELLAVADQISAPAADGAVAAVSERLFPIARLDAM